jgi:hypothetical protein
MGAMVVKKLVEDIYILESREERFKEMVKEYPKRFENAEMYSISVIQQKPHWKNNKNTLDLKVDGERVHGQYLMGWFMDKDNIEGLAQAAIEYVEGFFAIPKEERDADAYFADEKSDYLLDHFYESIGIDPNAE